MEKARWSGRVTSVQPRIRLGRSFDERWHSYLGYRLVIEGTVGSESRQFSVGIGKVAQAKHQFRVGDQVSGESVPVADPRREPVEFYRASKLTVLQRASQAPGMPPPWHGVPPDLETYRERGHRRLSARTYAARCTSCLWGCRMAVELTIDPWKRTTRYRVETFCCGPKSCAYYRSGPKRMVPGRKGMTFEEDDWIDEEMASHRGMDE